MKDVTLFLLTFFLKSADSQGRAHVRGDRQAAPSHNTKSHPATVPSGMGLSSEWDRSSVYQPP